MMNRLSFSLILALTFSACGEDDPLRNGSDNFETPDWSAATHEKLEVPNYGVVFPQEVVNSLEIEMTAEDWKKINTDMQEKFGATFGQGGKNSPSGGDGLNFGKDEPDYVAVSLKFNGIEWYKVGFRLKGNSTLSGSWRSGIYKLPFRLNFDTFEDTYSQVENQRFYGFKELSMSPGANDNTLIREKVGSDIFRMAGIPCSQTSFYKVYINFGSGKKYCGVYTMVEVVDDTMVKNQFGDDEGNIYKPESTFASFVAEDFEKKNNKVENDFSDVQAAIAALNSSLRISDPGLWRKNLEATFNVDHFLKWLAVNTTMLNWDSYGILAHNYYLYNDPQKKLTWIPWDNNESMLIRKRSGTITLSLSAISEEWPLIRYLIDDPVYFEQYKSYVHAFAKNVFTQDAMHALFDKYHSLISPYVVGPLETEQSQYTQLTTLESFEDDLTTLKQHVVTQLQAVENF